MKRLRGLYDDGAFGEFIESVGSIHRSPSVGRLPTITPSDLEEHQNELLALARRVRTCRWDAPPSDLARWVGIPGIPAPDARLASLWAHLEGLGPDMRFVDLRNALRERNRQFEAMRSDLDDRIRAELSALDDGAVQALSGVLRWRVCTALTGASAELVMEILPADPPTGAAECLRIGAWSVTAEGTDPRQIVERFQRLDAVAPVLGSVSRLRVAEARLASAAQEFRDGFPSELALLRFIRAGDCDECA